jgi:hypothetical protein
MIRRAITPTNVIPEVSAKATEVYAQEKARQLTMASQFITRAANNSVETPVVPAHQFRAETLYVIKRDVLVLADQPLPVEPHLPATKLM